MWINSADGHYELKLNTKAIVHHDGLIAWQPPATYKSACDIDVEYFPLDIQTCFLKLGSWTYAGYQVRPFTIHPSIHPSINCTPMPPFHFPITFQTQTFVFHFKKRTLLIDFGISRSLHFLHLHLHLLSLYLKQTKAKNTHTIRMKCSKKQRTTTTNGFCSSLALK